MTSLSYRGTTAPQLPLSAIVALTPTQLVADFPAILDTIQNQHLLLPPPTTPATSSTPPAASAHTRLLTKCLGLISQGHRASNPPEQWCGLQLLCTLIRQSSPATLTPHYQHITTTLSELQKQAAYSDNVLDLPLLECLSALLCSAAEASGETRREMMTTQLNKTVGTLIDRLIALIPILSAPASASATTHISVRRLLAALNGLLSIYSGSLRSFSSRLQPLLTSLLLHCDASCLPSLLNCLTTLLVSMTTAAASQHSNKAKQARMQQAAQDTSDEVAQQKLATTTASSTVSASSPYHAFAASCLQQMTAAVDELRVAVGEQSMAGGVRAGNSQGLGWEAVKGEGVLRGLETARRYERLCAVMAALVAPQLPVAVMSAVVELSVPLLPLLHVLFAALGVESHASSVSSTTETALTPSAVLCVLPSLHGSSLRLLDTLLQQCGQAMLPFVYPLSLLLVDIHRRCSITPSLEHLLPALYATLASLFHLPLSPSFLATLSGSFLTSLLAHVQQPFVLRRELTMQQTSQSMASQLKPTTAHNRRDAFTAATSATAATSELVGEQQDVREDVAAGALICLHALLEAGSLLPLAARTTIDSMLLLLAMSLSSRSAASLPLPPSIRLPLYRCLVSALMHPLAASPSAFTSPLLPYALPVLTRGASTAEGEESSVCRSGLLLCEWLTRERAGVAIGRRRKADRLFDRTEEEQAEDSHVLDRWDDWCGVAPIGSVRAGVRSTVADGESVNGGKRRRTTGVEGEIVEREQPSLSFATNSLAGVTRNGQPPEQKEGSERWREAEDEPDDAKQGAMDQSADVHEAETEHKQLTGNEMGEESDEQAEDEDEEAGGGSEQQGDAEEIDNDAKEKAGGDGRAAEHATSQHSGPIEDSADDEEFGAVLHVDDDSDDD